MKQITQICLEGEDPTLNSSDNIILLKKAANLLYSEAALQRCSYEKFFWKCAASLQENNHAESRRKWSNLLQTIKNSKKKNYSDQFFCTHQIFYVLELFYISRTNL